MKRVLKANHEPQSLAEFRTRFSAAPTLLTWSRFKKEPERREAVKSQLRSDQRGLCAYCENGLVFEDESVEHFVPRSEDHALELAWTNLLLCCCGGERPLSEDLADRGTRYDAQ